MEKEGILCTYPDCGQRILIPHPLDRDSPIWQVDMVKDGYCMYHGMTVSRGLIPVDDPEDKGAYKHWAMLNGKLMPFVDPAELILGEVVLKEEDE
jgi:hypothetical protein